MMKKERRSSRLLLLCRIATCTAFLTAHVKAWAPSSKATAAAAASRRRIARPTNHHDQRYPAEEVLQIRLHPLFALGPKSKSRFDFTPSDESSKKDDNDESPGFFRGLFRRKQNDDDEDPSDMNTRKTSSDKFKKDSQKARARAEAQRMEQQARERAARQAALLKKKQVERKKSIEKRDLYKQEDKEEEDVPLGAKIQSFLANNTFFNTTAPTIASNNPSAGSTTNNPFAMFQTFVSERLALASAGSQEKWVTVFPKTRIMPGAMVPVTVAGGLDLLVIASRDGRRLYCVANSCPHLGTPLETGQLVRLPVDSKTKGKGTLGLSTTATSSSSIIPVSKPVSGFNRLSERDVSNLLQQDGCEDCIVCPLHRTAFALESGDVRGEWCPYPPVLGKVVGGIKKPVGAAVFDVRTSGKNVQVRINTPLPTTTTSDT